MDNGFDVDDYEFVDPCLKQISSDIKKIFGKTGGLREIIIWEILQKLVYRPRIWKDQTLIVRLTENVEDSTSGGFHDNLQIGVNIEVEVDNVELTECLTHVEGIKPVSDVPVSCPIASFVSVEKRTEEIVDGGTLGGTKAMLPCGEESVEELGKNYREEWNCRNLRVEMNSRQGIHGPYLVKEVAGWTTAAAAGLHFSGEGQLGRWLTRRSRDCIREVETVFPEWRWNHSVLHMVRSLFGTNRFKKGAML